MSRQKFLAWVDKQQRLAKEVVACYEAGPLGFSLCRELKAMGVECYVACPQNWDERGLRIKNDKRDALALVVRLDRYLAGNHRALALVRVPSLEEDRLRSQSRQREQWLKHRQRLEIQGQRPIL